MNTSLKTILITALIAGVIGFVAGMWVDSSPTIERAQTGIRYLNKSMLELPEFNNPTLEPTGQLVFLPGKTTVDTVYQSLCKDHSNIEVPADYPTDILLTRREPVSKSGNEIQFRHYDPRQRAEVINTYQIEPSPWQWDLRLNVLTPVHTIDPVIGPRFEIGHEKFLLNIGAYLHPSTQSVHALGGVSIRLTGN